jgi:hypothetical protein
MDPEANMKRQIDLAREIVAIYSVGSESHDLGEAIVWRAEELAELVLAMHYWKTKGGGNATTDRVG